jgi:hypothetical protein
VGSTNYIIFRNADFLKKMLCDKEQFFVKEDEKSFEMFKNIYF